MNETKNYSITKSGAVILEGGANRGVFTAGALDFLMEQEYYIPHVIGVSAGACNALDYVSRQIGRTRDCMIVTDEKNRYVNKNIKTIVEKKALLDMDMVFERYPYEIFPFDFDTYFASPQTCELVVTNCETGRAEYLDDRENKERLLAIGRASSSMPIACPMVEIDGNEYVDGGVADSIPLHHAIEQGCTKMVVILSNPRNFVKKPEAHRPLYKHMLHKYPKTIQSIDKGQMEASRALGLNWFQAMRFVIMPQAFKRIIPPLGNEFIAMLKDSSLVSVIGFEELTRTGQLIISRTYAAFEIWIVVALLYLIMTLAISRFVALLEKRFSKGTRK